MIQQHRIRNMIRIEVAFTTFFKKSSNFPDTSTIDFEGHRHKIRISHLAPLRIFIILQLLFIFDSHMLYLYLFIHTYIYQLTFFWLNLQIINCGMSILLFLYEQITCTSPSNVIACLVMLDGDLNAAMFAETFKIVNPSHYEKACR